MNWVTGTQTRHHDMKSDPVFEIKVRSTTAELAGSVNVSRNNYCTFPFMRTELFWVITQRVVVISDRRFWTLEDGSDRLSRNVGKKCPLLAA
jgi:hypothetical protein